VWQPSPSLGTVAGIQRVIVSGGDVPGTEGSASAARWFASRVRRHWYWARTQGLGRLIEEDRLNPFERVPLAVSKWWWRRTHRVAPMAVPVFLVGLQRSGTNMLVRGLERSPEFEVHNENDRAAFVRFRLRPDAVIRLLVERSGHRFVLFKPLCDSHRTVELLDGLGTPSPGRAIWVYRDVDDRTRSAIAKFGPANLVALRRIAAGSGAGLWQAGGLSPQSLELIGSFDLERMSPETAAALFWYLRNLLYFDLGLHQREDVTLVCYDFFVEEPERQMRALSAFLGLRYDDRFVAHVASRRRGPHERLAIDERVRSLCDELRARLDEAAGEKASAPSSA
jgi:hypothetical protein